MEIVCDTREQLPLTFRGCNVARKKLDFGDYACALEDETLIPIVFERKSALDLFNTLGKGHARFKREIERSIVNGYKLYVIVESSYTDIERKNFKNSFRTKMKGFVVIKICHSLELKYGVRFIFARDRLESARIIKNFFKGGLKLYEGNKK